MRRALIVANKWWEADPLVATLSSAKTCPPMLAFIHEDEGGGLRGYFQGARGRVEVWCVQELMAASASGSSTAEKAHVLPPLLSSDQKVVDAYTASGATQPVGSLETTHGVIRECTPNSVPFVFVSGITDRVGFFDDEVGTAPYQQNFVAAHNAGVAVAAMMPAIMAYLAPG